MKGFKIPPEEQERIRRAAAAAEAATSGEIASAVILQSSSYAFPELVAALAGGVIFFLAAMLAYGPLSALVNSWFWEPRDWYVTAFYGLATLGVTGLLYALGNIPGADRLIVPRKIRETAVHRRALIQFVESGVYNTRDRTGILIFLSLRERRVELLADTGISALVPRESWNGILEELTLAIRKGEPGPGLVRAMESCGRILAEHFPRKSDDTNELPDGLVFLED